LPGKRNASGVERLYYELKSTIFNPFWKKEMFRWIKHRWKCFGQ